MVALVGRLGRAVKIDAGKGGIFICKHIYIRVREVDLHKVKKKTYVEFLFSFPRLRDFFHKSRESLHCLDRRTLAVNTRV